jgi:cell division protein FtsB
MGRVLPGENYCLGHQGNHSHYAEINCTVCKLQAENAKLKAHVVKLEATVEALEDELIEAGIAQDQS